MVFTIIIRNHEWLAAGATVSVLTYSGVAAVHSLILFAANNRLDQQQAKTRCELIPIPGSNNQFFACAGSNDPDVSVIVHVVTAVMLGALPMAAWSTTFRKSASKSILIFWILLLAVGHTFYPLTLTNQNFHFQICPMDHVEPLPRANFRALVLDEAWSKSFRTLVEASQQASPAFENGTVPACLYSCFATTAYIGRGSQDVMVSPTIKRNPFLKSSIEERLSIVIFWWAYTFLALLTLFTTEKQSVVPGWARKRVCSVGFGQRSWILLWKWEKQNKEASKPLNMGGAGGDDTITAHSLTAARPHPARLFQITLLHLIQFLTQLISVIAFGGTILYNEITESRQGMWIEVEQFTAVGQWNYVAVVLLVLFAAVVSRKWTAAGKATSLEKGDEWHSEERIGMEDWDCRVGYAS
ncbi:uncharacterized protein KY384_007815 [Bacidia gigantensis]|uniref:uncharacterized protein n=1 Tax=Bacidia gigantensis TaxID=2732470 RepID=UPI001D050489|nr:uncharacterized protein KY384_007815 [Bacidia gigantensis]KAG8527662.1 hypothetical protein KY384_007815 [Bacidia gigantensis]